MKVEPCLKNPGNTAYQDSLCLSIGLASSSPKLNRFRWKSITRIYNERPPPMAQQPLAGHALLIIEALRSHPDTLHSVGLLWTPDQPEPETSRWQHTILTRDRLACPRRGSNPNPSNRVVTGVGYNVRKWPHTVLSGTLWFTMTRTSDE